MSEHSHEHSHHHAEHGHQQQAQHGRHEDWFDDEFVEGWLERQKDREEERRRQFLILRALVPKAPEQEFSYINLGAGGGPLDEVLLSHFPNAQATVLDGSLAMLAAARRNLTRFEGRVEYVQANLEAPEWVGAVSGPFDVAISSIAIHNLRDPRRIRDVYAEVFRLLGHGGTFLNLDYVRPAKAELAQLAAWAAKDKEAAFNGRGGGTNMPGTLAEQLGWLSEAGFSGVDVFWKELNVAVMCGLRDHLHLPEANGHSHSH